MPKLPSLLPLSMTLAFLAPAPGFGQALVRSVLPACAPPDSAVWLELRVELQPGQTLKTYDLRIPFHPADLAFEEAGIQQGSWFSSVGPTFFWHDIIDSTLYLSGALLGPNLAASGAGVVARIPLRALGPGVADLGAVAPVLYDRDAAILPSLSLPAALQCPCVSLSLRIQPGSPESGRVRLDWNPQAWIGRYQVESRLGAGANWQARAEVEATQWSDSLDAPRREYRVRAVLSGGNQR